MGGINSIPFFNCGTDNAEAVIRESDVSDCEDCLGSVVLKLDKGNVINEEKNHLNDHTPPDGTVIKQETATVAMRSEINVDSSRISNEETEIVDVPAINSIMDETTRDERYICENENISIDVNSLKAESENVADITTCDEIVQYLPAQHTEMASGEPVLRDDKNNSHEEAEIDILKTNNSCCIKLEPEEKDYDQTEINDCDVSMTIHSKNKKTQQTISKHLNVERYERVEVEKSQMFNATTSTNVTVKQETFAYEDTVNYQSNNDDCDIPMNITRENEYGYALVGMVDQRPNHAADSIENNHVESTKVDESNTQPATEKVKKEKSKSVERVIDENKQVEFISRADIKNHRGHDWWNILNYGNAGVFACSLCNLITNKPENMQKCKCNLPGQSGRGRKQKRTRCKYCRRRHRSRAQHHCEFSVETNSGNGNTQCAENANVAMSNTFNGGVCKKYLQSQHLKNT